MSNLALSCSLCNQRKSHVTMAVDPGGQDLTIVRLFNPRVDLWAAHFGAYLFDDRIEIRGRTRIGRATVSQLNMNDPHAVRARLLWALMNLFPP